MNKFGEALHEKYSLHFSEVQNGEKIEELIESKEYWKIKEGERMLTEFEARYREGKEKKWIIFAIFLILGGVIGYYLPIAVFYLGNSNYNRATIDAILFDYFGHATMDEILTDEALVVAYSYNA